MYWGGGSLNVSKIEIGGFLEIMKKFMILMLSLAVLFSFAACDNSSNTPDTEEPTTPSEVPYGQTVALATAEKAAIGSAFDVFDASTKIVEDEEAAENYKVDVAGTQYTITYSKATEGTTDVEDASLTIVLNGVDVTKDEKATSREIQLSTYTMTFSKPEASTYARIEGTYAGYVTGKLAATVDAAGTLTALAVDSTAPVVYLPEVATKVTGLTYGGIDVNAKYFVANLNKGATDTSPASYEYKKTANTTAQQTAIEGFVTVLIGDNTTDKLANLVADLTKEGAVAKGVYDSTGDGKATITFTAGNEAVKLASDDSSQYVYLPANGSMVLELVGAEDGNAASGSFTVAKYTFVSGTLRVCDTDDINDVHDAFSSITLNGVSGKATGTVKSNGSTVVNAVDTLAFTDTTAGTVTASAIVAPQYGATAETVTVDYAD